MEALRGNIILQGAKIAQELETQRNALIRCESCTTQVEQVGNQAVAELDAIMSFFRAELVQTQTALA